MANQTSGYKRPGRNGQRYRHQINHKRYEKYFTGNKEQREFQFKEWVAQLEAKYKNRTTDNSVTYSTFKRLFLEYLRGLKDKTTGERLYQERTAEEYANYLTDFEMTMHPKYVQDITYPIVAEYRRRIRKQADDNNNNYYGVNKKMGCNMRALKWGMAEGFLPVFSMEALERLDTGEVIVRTITPAQVALLIKYSPLTWRVGIKMGFYAGLRPEEAINFIKSKIDFKTGIVKIWEHKADPAHGITAWRPKAKKRRLVYFPQDLLDDIKKLNPATYVLTDDEGTPYSVKNFSNAFKDNLKHVNDQILRHEADTAPIQCTYKTLRKSNITALIDTGLGEKDASLELGHVDKKTSEKHYINKEVLAKQKEREQLEQINKIKAHLLKLPAALKKKREGVDYEI